jgi:hypothetical protein
MIAPIKTSLALAATLALAGTCSAQTVGLHLATAHEYADMNGSNPGAYVRLALLLTPDKGAAVHLSMEWRL